MAPTPQVHGERIKRFMLHLVLNHTVIPETMRDDDGEVIGMQLSASSPDEEAFVCVPCRGRHKRRGWGGVG